MKLIKVILLIMIISLTITCYLLDNDGDGDIFDNTEEYEAQKKYTGACWLGVSAYVGCPKDGLHKQECNDILSLCAALCIKARQAPTLCTGF
ncbi:MAG: hypothetical protein H7A23_02780 [Leptospiraceae bacterium]|nr:hypothetical protein [Leptospiraceae bacterium]MCP5493456.1 hypothetical protein [Leptospiraceae bacterium]